MALNYVARFATTAKALERYCRRKIREHEWAEGEALPDIDALVARFVEHGYVNDAVFARARTGGLLRRGYGERRINAALDQAGVDWDDRREIGEFEARSAALRMAQKKGFGPFAASGEPPAERALREKQIASMLRAGHALDSARELVNAASQEIALEWAEEMRPQEPDEEYWT
ncbi:regulatory protein RecX [Croceicoccus mobilis]|uniref:Regulatory protein RecX n=1 Tax=Croceicoccus mobilis TaxID=1703339 RepID=A0A917DUP4_9SPHN|nr:RecX family transcriptional regulator [Croceicoccus mobilis]GGD70654.1 hypothetical protein GCM10010990_20210 [Croceicoccus mobilis]